LFGVSWWFTLLPLPWHWPHYFCLSTFQNPALTASFQSWVHTYEHVFSGTNLSFLLFLCCLFRGPIHLPIVHFGILVPPWWLFATDSFSCYQHLLSIDWKPFSIGKSRT
jgi:hypothetical protein